MTFELGRTYSHYEFLGLVKQTNATVAYRVRNHAAGREELLYVLSEAGQDDPRQRERFMREMGLRARLSHPNIPAFLNATDLEGNLVMTTELVEGRSLAEALKSGPLPWRQALEWTQQILPALACAHELGITHRDIGPDSIILTASGAAKLSDFRVAKGATSPQLTQVGTIFGNCRYISPEQVRGTAELDCRSDIYSLGAVLYEMLCGRPPFAAPSDFEVMRAHLKETPRAPSEFHGGVPRLLDPVVLKALAKDPAGRYATCAEFAHALESATDELEHPRPAAQERGPERGRWTLLGSAAAGFVLLLLAIWFIARL